MEGEQSSSSVSAPNSVNYGDQLPLGIEAKSQKRLFFPTTGDTYTPGSNTICRIDVNYDGLLDTQQSFLEFDLQNTSVPMDINVSISSLIASPHRVLPFFSSSSYA